MSSLYSHLRQLWKKPKELYRPIIRGMDDSFERVDKPTRLDRARSLGYKAKQGFVVVRAKIKKGGRIKPRPRKARKPGKMGTSFTQKHSLQTIVERRAVRKYPNTEVLNSYYVSESGTHKVFEVLLVDRDHPVIKSDKDINWITTQRRRAFRGLTAKGKKGKTGKKGHKKPRERISYKSKR